MSDLDDLMSSIMGSMGLAKRVQIRTKFIDHIDLLVKKGLSDEEIDIFLFMKLKKEFPQEFVKVFGPITPELNRSEIIQKLNEPSEVDEGRLQILDRQVSKIQKEIQSKPRNHNTVKKPFLNSRIKYFLKATVSGWFIWALFLFSLSVTEVTYFRDSEEWFTWLFFPPIVLICLVVWVKKFVLK